MKGLISFLLICAIAVALALAAGDQSGQVQILWPPDTLVTLSLNFALLLLVGGFVLLYALIGLVRYAFGLPEQVRRYRLARRKQRARESMVEATAAMFEGRYRQAVKLADKALEFDEQPAMNRLIAARSAHHLGQFDQRDAWFDAAAKNPVLKNAVEVSRAALFIDTGHCAEAEAAIDRIPVKARAPLAYRFLIKAAFGRADYDKALRLLRGFGRQDDPSGHKTAVLKRAALQRLLADLTLTPDRLALQWRTTPDEERDDVDTVELFVRCGIRLGDARFCRTLIEHSLSRQWHSSLAGLYGDFLDGDDGSAQIERAEAWLHDHPKDADLLCALGNLCYRKRLWGKARNYFEASLAVAPTLNTKRALAKLLDELDAPDEADRLYRQIVLDVPTS